MSNKNLYKAIEEQQKVIQYLAEKYKNDTGCEITLPQTWSGFLGVNEEKAPIYEFPTQPEPYQLEKKGEFDTFLQAMTALNLPQRKVDSKKSQSQNQPVKGDKGGTQKNKAITTNFDPNNKFHMIEKIDLSNFVSKKFSRAGFRELLDSIADMRCLHTIILKNNGIDDNYCEELENLLTNPRITSVDLSENNIGRPGVSTIAKTLKEKSHHIEWIDLSRNPFCEDYMSISSLCLGFRSQKNLAHFGLSVNSKDPKADSKSQFNLAENAVRLLQTHLSIKSISLIDSKLTQSSITILYNVLTQPGYYITGLSFKYSFLDTRSIYTISKALEINRSLVRLDLSGNGLSPIMGVYLAKSLKNNVTLMELNLEKNCLNDDFAEELAELLKKNDILWKVDISYNPIGDKGAKALLKSIRENNDTLESLGDDFYSNSPSMGVIAVQEILKVLKQNKVSKEIRSKMLSDEKNISGQDPKNLTVSQVNYSSTQSILDFELEDYKLFKPILFTNELFPEKQNIRLWNV